MKIQNIFNFGLILLISVALMLSGCAKEEDSSTSTGESGGGDTVAQVVTALQGAVKTFGSASSSRSSAASGTSLNVDQGVKSLVSLYLMIDTDYKYPVAKVKSAEDGSYEISSDDIKDFLINPPTSGLDTDYGYVLPDDATGITSSSSASAIKTAFQALGPLTVRALYVKDGKAKAITAMADPTSTEAVRVDPIVSKVATQIIGKLVETIKATINSISGLGDSLKKTLLANVISAVKDTVVSTLESVKDTTVFELPEGTDASTIADPESLLEVEMDSSTLAELNTQIESSDETVTIDTTSIAVADSGKLADTLTDAEKGALEKKADETSASASTAVAAQDASAGKKIKVAGLQKYFLALGFPVILDQQSDNTTVVAVPLKVPSDVDEGDLPGKSTFGDRSIRHFLVKGSSSSSAPSSGDFSSATELSSGITSLTTALSSYMMSDNASIVDDRKLDNASKSLLSRLRTFHRLNKTMKEGLPLVSKELVEWMAKNDNATVPLKDVATQIAKLSEWRQERIVFSNGIPVFTGKMLKPKSGATVKATDLITALTVQMGANASSTAAKLTDENKSFWAPFAGPALADEVMRKASSFKGASQQSVESEMGKIIPKTESDYLTFLRGGTYTAFDNSTVTVPPSPGYMDAKASIAKGLVLALPDDAYGESNTLNGETKLSGKASVFLVNYMLNIMYPLDRAQGMLSTDNTTGMVLPQIENFKQLHFTSDPSVSEIAGAIMGVTAPTDNVTHAFSESRMRSGALMDLSSLQLAEFREFDANAIGLSSSNTADLQCTIKFYDGDDGTGDDKWDDLTATLLKVDQTTGDFEATTFGNNLDGTLSTNGSGASRAYSISGVPTNQEYLIRFKMKTYTNDLPDIFVYVDGFEANMNVCGEEGFVIGPDIEDKPVPGMGLMAGTSKTDSEGIDFSNYSIPGALTLIFPEDENSGRGTRDLMLTKSGSTFTLLAGDNMSFDLQNESGIHSLLGQSLTTRISGFSEEDITICSSGCTITPGTYGGLDDKLVILKVSASEYWLLELRFLDTNFGFLDFGFAKITAQGRAEFPDAGFEKGPVDVAKASVVQHSYLMFGDGYKLSDNSMQFAFNMDGNVNTSMGSDFRYAGKYFKQKISSMSDMDSNNFWQDSSNIPVRIDGTSKNSNGEVNIRFRKFTYKKSNRTYELDNTSSTSATDLDHNDLLAVFPNCTATDDSTGDGCNPSHLLRVIRFDTTSLQANMGLELEIAKVQENPSDKRNNVVEFTSTASDKYPSLSMNGVTIGYVYDGDYDGVPYIMDPNDDDPNQPGSGGGPAGAMAGDPGMHGGFGGQGVSLMLRNKYSYATSGTTKLDGDVWDNKSPTRSVMIIMDGFWPDEIESFNISNSDLSLNNMRVFTCSKASFDAYGGFSSAAKCTADNSSVSGITISKSMVSEGKIVFELGHSASLFKSGKSLDITTKAKKSKYSYSLKFRQPTDYAGNPFMCGNTACPSMPPMEGEINIRFPKADDTNKDYGVGPFTGIKVSDGTEVDVRDVSKLDSQKDIKISSSKVSNATEYTLHVYCAGTESSTMYEPPFEWEMKLPNASKAPEWNIPRNTIWGGRSCDFRLIAFGEDSVGNPIGSTIYKFTDTLKGGGGMAGPMMDLNVMISPSNLNVCYDATSKSVSSQGSSCSVGSTLLWTSDLSTNSGKITLSGGETSSIKTHSMGYKLAEGDIDVSQQGQAVGFKKENSSPTPTCGIISNGDFFKDPFECSSEIGMTDILIMTATGAIVFPSDGSITKLSGDDLTDANWNMGPRNAQLNYKSGSDNFTFNVRVDRWGEEKRAYVSVDLQEESSGLSFGNGEYFEIKVGDQPIGFDVRYASSSEAELGYWLMAEQKTVADGDFQIDGVTVWSKSGNTITFDNGTSVWNPQIMQSVTSADISSGQHFNFDITITSSSTTYMVWIDIMSGSPVVGYEKMQFVAPTGGFGGDMGGGGMGGGPLFTMWVPKGEYICSDGFGGFWNMPSACDGQAVTLLYLNPAGTLDLGSSFTISQNDNKPDESGGSYAFDNSSSPAKRTLHSSQWQDAFYRFKTSGGQSFDVRTFSADYWDEGSGEAFQGMALEILPGADQFSGHAGGGHTDGGYNDGGGSQVGGKPSIWAKGACSELNCEYKEETHSDPQGGSITSYNSNLAASQDSWVSVNVEKGPPPDLNQNYTSWGGIPEHMGCTTKTIDFAASVNVGGARSQVIWGENCSMTGGGATYTGVAIAFIEQDHYVTVFASGITTKSELGSDTSLTGILSGITWVTSNPGGSTSEDQNDGKLRLTVAVTSNPASVRMTGPWWSWDPNGGPEAVNNGNGTWTVKMDPPTASMEYLWVVDGNQENIVDNSPANFTCTPVTDYGTYANRQWILNSGDVQNDVFDSCTQ